MECTHVCKRAKHKHFSLYNKARLHGHFCASRGAFHDFSQQTPLYAKIYPHASPHAPRIERVRAVYLSKCPHTCAVASFAVGVRFVDFARVGGGEFLSASTSAHPLYFGSPFTCEFNSLNSWRAVLISHVSPSASRMCSHGSGSNQSLPSNRHLLQNTRTLSPLGLVIHSIDCRAPSVFHAFSAVMRRRRSCHDLHQLRSEKGRALPPVPPVLSPG